MTQFIPLTFFIYTCHVKKGLTNYLPRPVVEAGIVSVARTVASVHSDQSVVHKLKKTSVEVLGKIAYIITYRYISVYFIDKY